MSVLFIISQTGRSANGGVESATQLLENIGDALSISVITNMQTPVNARWEAVGADVSVNPLPYELGASKIKGGLLGPIKYLLSLLRTNAFAFRRVKSGGVKLVHCNDVFSQVHYAAGAKLAGAKVLFNIRDVFPPEKPYRLKWKIARTLSSHILVLSKEMREQLARRLPPRFGKSSPDDISHIYSVVDMEKMKPATAEGKQGLREQLRIEKGTFTFLYAASVCAKKNQLTFLEQAGPKIKASGKPMRVIFVGDFDTVNNPYAKQCADAIERLGLGDVVQFHGYSANVDQWFRAVDGIVLPTRYEGLARCMIEPLCCGTPVLSLNVCSAREILEGYGCGQVLEQGDYEGLVAAMVAWQDKPELLSRYRENALNRVRPLFQAMDASANYLALLKTLMP